MDVTHIPYDQGEHVTTAEYFAMGGLLVAVSVAGVLINGIAMLAFIKCKELQSPTNSFVFALCVCNFVMCAIGTPIPAYHAFAQKTVENMGVCVTDGFIVFFLGCTSIYILSAISIDRYIVIVKPQKSYLITHKIVTSTILLCALISLFWSTLPLFGWNRYVREGIGIACSVSWASTSPEDQSFTICLFTFCFALPIIVMGVCYINIYSKARSVFRRTASYAARTRLEKEKKLLKTIVLVIIVFIITWLPYAVISFLTIFLPDLPISKKISMIPVLVAKSSAVWTSIAFVTTNVRFRKAFVSVLPKFSISNACDEPAFEKTETEAAPVTEIALASSPGQSSKRVPRNMVLTILPGSVDREISSCLSVSVERSPVPKQQTVISGPFELCKDILAKDEAIV